MATTAELIERAQRYIEEGCAIIETKNGKELRQLIQSVQKENQNLVVDYLDLIKFDPDLGQELTTNPKDTLAIFDKVIEVLRRDVEEDKPTVRARFMNVDTIKTNNIMIRDIRVDILGQFKCVSGTIKSISSVLIETVSIKFECPSCGNILHVLQKRFSERREPSKCGCERKGKFHMLDETKIDVQKLVIEEDLEGLENTQQPNKLDVVLLEGLTTKKIEKRLNLGARVCISGIIMEKPVLDKGRISTESTPYMEANFIRSLEEKYKDVVISEDDLNQIKELSKKTHILEILTNSFAPGIYGYQEIKKAIVLQLFGGVTKWNDKTQRMERGNSHILLIGDPGLGKTQLAKATEKLALKYQYCAGTSSSKAGLTYMVSKDDFIKTWTVEAGAFVMASGGICVTGDTLIQMGDGSFKRIDEIYNQRGSPYVASMNKELVLQPIIVQKLMKTEKQNVMLIKTKSGDSLKITDNHPLPKWDNGIVWTKISDLKEGDYIFCCNKFLFPSQDNNKDFMELAGLVISDGHLPPKKNSIYFYSSSQELIQRFIELCQKLSVIPRTYKDNRGLNVAVACSKSLKERLQSLGIVKGNKSKTFMDLSPILDMGHNDIKSFLIGLINGDGSISNRKGGGKINISCGNLSTSEEYRKLLRKIGVISYVSTMKQTGMGKLLNRPTKNYINYSVDITGINNISKLIDNRLISYKLKNILIIKDRQDKSGKIPNIYKLLDTIRLQLKHTHKQFMYLNSVRTSLNKKGFGIRNQTLKKFLIQVNNLDYMQKSEELKILNKIAFGDYYFNEIVSISKLTQQEDVYNLEVQSDGFEPNYIANFIPVHNCVMDEFDKISDEDTSALHTGMEEQIIPVNKANIHRNLTSQTKLLCCANWKGSRYNQHEPIYSQINLPDSLISRFDWFGKFIDIPEKERDEKVILASFGVTDSNDELEKISYDLFHKYIIHASQFNPQVPDSLMRKIATMYSEIRSKSKIKDDELVISITPRQGQAIKRFMESSARIHLRDCNEDDLEVAKNLVQYSLQEIAGSEGMVDIDKIETGISSEKRHLIYKVRDAINELSIKFKEIPRIDIITSIPDHKDFEVDKVIDELKRHGEIFEPRNGYVMKI